ncbi:DUF1015 family protein [Neolewinella lacunae]|uniref:DUF1015 family protein n=1 Tax=Neolewinella lacunae TaxID=1517758 RepID=A0A923PFP4_9BACT|nr:DUF1015 family protein [Neolewinella lacunae]MBC6993278.1 DUF1015 family protein [Neolewinella lacunae]MDN3635675.1 DUF1015 family protein [Neolewinella lacunae]
MTVSLYPFPQYHHPPRAGFSELPFCRDGVRCIPPGQLEWESAGGFGELRIQRHRTGEWSRGICGLLPSAAFSSGLVRPHEATLQSRLARQEILTREEGGALGKPVLLTTPQLAKWWARVDGEYVAEGGAVTFVGNDNTYHLRRYLPRMGQLPQPLDLAEAELLCIADGHHRAATHAALAAQGYAACAFLPVCIIGGEEVSIGSFTRVIEDDMGNTDEVLKRLGAYFMIEATPSAIIPSVPGEWAFSRNHLHYRLTRKSPQGRETAAEWLDAQVLAPVFGIVDSKRDHRITFEMAPEPGDDLAQRNFLPDRTYLSHFPLTTDRFFAEVAAGRMLPAKSTRFEPRVPSGMLVWMP